MGWIQRISRIAPLIGLWFSTLAFAASDCALAPNLPGVVLEYRGECRDGRVHGVAEVMLELPAEPARRLRQFGWFQRGVPQGTHVGVLTDPQGQAPGFAMLMSFDASGHTHWRFGLAASQWPRAGNLLTSGPWEDVEGQARKAGIDYQVAKRADGTAYGDGLTLIADVLNQAAEFSVAQGVQTVPPASLREFLIAIPIDQPLVTVRTDFSSAAMLPDTDDAAPAARATFGTEATLQPGELMVKTREGCGLITQVADEKYRQTLIDSHLRKSWLGECVEGMVLGPGTLLVRTQEDRISLIQRQWYFNGRPIGATTLTTFSSGDYKGGITEAFSWEGTTFSRSKSAVGAPVPQTMQNNPPMAMEYSPQRKVLYRLLRSDGGKPADCGPDGSVCLQETNLGALASTVSYFRCKKNDCAALWAEKVAPVLLAYEAFKAHHAEDVQAAQESVAPVLAPLQSNHKTARREAEVARAIREAENAYEAEQTRATAAAEQERLTAAKAKAAEDAAKAESSKNFWGNVLSGVTALAGAMATYAGAKERLAPTSPPAPAIAALSQPATSATAPKRALPVTYTNHPNSTNECVELRGHSIGNKCGFDLLVSWCVAQPQQTKNFFDSSAAFECGKGGGFNTIKAGSVEGNVLYGYINYYACPYTDYYTPARMKTSFAFEGGLGLYRGTCGDGDKLSNNWTIGGMLVSRPRQ